MEILREQYEKEIVPALMKKFTLLLISRYASSSKKYT